VLIVGATHLSALYARALVAQGVPARQVSAKETVLAGLSVARRSVSEALPWPAT
jgi:2-dehydro-3-deoxygalactonokinase